jgi:hypothetical protein
MQYLHLIIEETSILGKLNAYVMQTPPNVYLKNFLQNPTWVQKVVNVCCFPNSKSIA